MVLGIFRHYCEQKYTMPVNIIRCLHKNAPYNNLLQTYVFIHRDEFSRHKPISNIIIMVDQNWC